MIIPIKCFTCGKVLADKYLYYTQRVNEIKTSRGLDKDEVISSFDFKNWSRQQLNTKGCIVLEPELLFDKTELLRSIVCPTKFALIFNLSKSGFFSLSQFG